MVSAIGAYEREYFNPFHVRTSFPFICYTCLINCFDSGIIVLRQINKYVIRHNGK